MGCCCKKKKAYSKYIKYDRNGQELEVKIPSIDDYEFIKKIGQGNFGEVFLVSLKGIKNEYFAMKRLNKEKLLNDLYLKLAKGERDAWVEAKSDFIVNLKQVFQDKNYLYLVSQYVPGKDLAFLFKKMKRQFSLDMTRFYIAELILAVEDLHSQNIIHRDIKLENILLDSAGHIKLTDFGFSKLLKRKGRTETLCGTPNYIAPEVVLNPTHDKGAYWWSVGCLMYGMLEGNFPFDIDLQVDINNIENINKIENEYKKVVGFQKIKDANAKDLIKKFLKIDPEKRLGTSGIEKIKENPFFENIDWDSARKKELIPPFIPEKEENIEKDINLDIDLEENNNIDKKDKSYLKNFTFISDSLINILANNNDNNEDNNDGNNNDNNVNLLNSENI